MRRLYDIIWKHTPFFVRHFHENCVSIWMFMLIFCVFFSHTHSIFAALFFWVISVLSRSLEFYFIPVALSLHFLLINFKLNIIIIIIVHIRLLMRHNSIVIRWYLWVQVIIIFHLQLSFSFFLFPPYLPLIHAHSASLFASDSLYSFIALLHFGFFFHVFFSLSLSSCYCFYFLCSVWFFICFTHSKWLSFEVWSVVPVCICIGSHSSLVRINLRFLHYSYWKLLIVSTNWLKYLYPYSRCKAATVLPHRFSIRHCSCSENKMSKTYNLKCSKW